MTTGYICSNDNIVQCENSVPILTSTIQSCAVAFPGSLCHGTAITERELCRQAPCSNTAALFPLPGGKDINLNLKD